MSTDQSSPSVLSAQEVRVLGSLVEKDLTTPEYYPLSLNALTNACNQINNRDPVVSYGEPEVSMAMEGLRDKRLGYVVSGGDSRVLKYGHKLGDHFNLQRPEVSVLCVLLLRGPQTPGEIRGRTGRMHAFESPSAVQAVLTELASRPDPLVKMLPRQPGTKESRYTHLLAGEPEVGPAPAETGSVPGSAGAASDDDRVARLEREVAALRQEIAALREEIAKRV